MIEHADVLRQISFQPVGAFIPYFQQESGRASCYEERNLIVDMRLVHLPTESSSESVESPQAR